MRLYLKDDSSDKFINDEKLSEVEMGTLSRFRQNLLIHKGKHKDATAVFRPRSKQAFWRVLKRKNGSGLRINRISKLHDCDICRSLPGHQAMLTKALVKSGTGTMSITKSRERQAYSEVGDEDTTGARSQTPF
jgi:hypothetical protein